MTRVTAVYQDEKGNEIATPLVTSGDSESAYFTSAQTIIGYKLGDIPANITGTYTDEDGKEIIAAKAFIGKYVESGEITAVCYQRLEVVSPESPVKAQFGENDQTITLVYKK